MNLDDVAVFIAVDEHASFSAAARYLGVSKVAVSRAIARLEFSLGVQLLMRTSRHVWLTSVGRDFREAVKQSVSSLSDAVRSFSQRDLKPGGFIRVGITAPAAALCLEPSIARFAESHPTLRLELQTTVLAPATSDAFDVLLGFPGEAERAELWPGTSRYVGAVTFQLFAAPQYLAKHGVPEQPSDLAKHSHVLTLSLPAKIRGSHLSEVERAGQSIVCSDVFAARELVRLGYGLGLFPRPFVASDIASAALVPVMAASVAVPLDLWLLLSAAPRLSALTSAFCELVTNDLRRRRLVAVPGVEDSLTQCAAL